MKTLEVFFLSMHNSFLFFSVYFGLHLIWISTKVLFSNEHYWINIKIPGLTHIPTDFYQNTIKYCSCDSSTAINHGIIFMCLFYMYIHSNKTNNKQMFLNKEKHISIQTFIYCKVNRMSLQCQCFLSCT